MQLWSKLWSIKELYFMSRRGDNIHKRKDGRWEAQYIITYNENNKAIYSSVYGKTYSEVKSKLDYERSFIYEE